MSNSALDTALTLASNQLAAARAGLFDELISGLPRYEEACALVVATDLSTADEPGLRKLIALNARIGTYVAAATADAANHMRRLREGRSVAEAYYGGTGSGLEARTADARA